MKQNHARHKFSKANHARYKAILASRKQAETNEMNQPVHIRDLVLTTAPGHSHGEAEIHTNIYGKHFKQRLLEHARFLFQFANENHRAHYCEQDGEGHYQLREDSQNNVTRLLMNEFSLYTEVPLKMDAFEELLKGILEEKLDPNVQVLLSSFAVRDETGKLCNIAIFVEGGDPPTIHTFAKNTAYGIDVDYGKRFELFSQQKRGYYASFHAESAASETGSVVPTAGIFEVTTQGGAQYTQVVDICSDHTGGHAKSLMFRRIRNPERSGSLLPEQVEHCITSNSVTRTEKNSLSDCVIQADPRVKVHVSQDLPLGERILSDEARARLTSDEYPQLGVLDDAHGYVIRSPIFGSDCNVEVLDERPAARYLPETQAEVEAHNERVRGDISDRHLGATP